MHDLELSGLLGVVALSLPLLALLTVMALALRQIANRRRKVSAAVLTARYGEPVADRLPKSLRRSDGQPGKAVSTPAPIGGKELVARIAKLEGTPNSAELPQLYLSLARERMSENKGAEAAEVLRKCIRLATAVRQNQVHAAARLELGDMVRDMGDLTTACEHWQIARGLYHDLKVSADLAACETRMRQNGCPTDWVLNDF